MLLQFSLGTKVTKEVLVTVDPFCRKIGTKRRGVILPSPVIEVVRLIDYFTKCID